MEKEKLIIKNFGPIKHVELDIKKVNVLIGEQGTGKSALARLLNLFSDSLFLFGNDEIRKARIDDYGFFFKPNTFIEYTSLDFTIKYDKIFSIEYNNKKKLLKRYIALFSSFIIKHDFKLENEYYSLKKWSDEHILSSKYIPAERISITTINQRRNDRGNLDQYIVDFGNEFIQSAIKIKELKIAHLKNVTYRRENDMDVIIFNDERLFLYQTSSGFQASIPLAVFIEYFTSIKEKTRFIIEEPELNLFPTTQYELMKYLVAKTSPEKNGLFLATHSPYILSSINNMMYAFQMGKIDPEKASGILDSKYWLNPNDVSAYYLLPDGSAENIMDYEIMQINGERIDYASDIINREYDEMLSIKYGNK